MRSRSRTPRSSGEPSTEAPADSRRRSRGQASADSRGGASAKARPPGTASSPGDSRSDRRGDASADSRTRSRDASADSRTRSRDATSTASQPGASRGGPRRLGDVSTRSRGDATTAPREARTASRPPGRASGDPSPAPLHTTAKGRSAEDRAEAFLRQRGYEIVERNARSAVGEIDLIAIEGGDLVFVEVRSRADASSGGAEETVGAEKQRRVVRAAASYLAERSPRFDTCRFDVVAITGDEIVLFQDAFRLSGADAERF